MAQYTPVEFPYYAPRNELPAPLPTIHDIQNATEIIDDGGWIEQKVVGIGPFVVKYGEAVSLEEGQKMQFVRACTTTVRVPRVYALFKDPLTPANYIVMEKIQGQTLQTLWASLDDGRKDRICRQLETNLTEMRALPSPGGYCALGNLPLNCPIYCKVRPTSTEAEFNDALADACVRDVPDRHNPKEVWWTEYIRRAFASSLRDHPPTFSHGDLQTKNIMVSPEDDTVTIIDWELSGWFPSYWEYTSAMIGAAGTMYETDWYKWMERFLVPYYNETAWHSLVSTCKYGGL
ncbi:uncharacterized protein PV06_08151 [Exophiala oligosperma]|uniref:Aminoglycoside phosphotransferase domain-containing protein n=2 Tax=Chaetothyriales TaxID=34395 RepID=A0A0D2DAW6_9EURO|nr:uncharacterized protein PV06_08151 [Exophiala oligosperma]KAJ9636997.1 hypothetical protein H2204_005145 [Knufia peltigerae]KIW39550.1 hypothetical protein PV06_08151 [Exophiala oligosperma]